MAGIPRHFPFRSTLVHSWKPVALALFLSVGCSSCSSPFSKRESKYREEVSEESTMVANSADTAYKREMTNVLRKSRLMPMDSLARLYVRMAEGSDAEQPAVRAAVSCELARKYAVYG